MERLQWAGPALAVVTFVTIGAGHVLVRRLHARFRTRPAGLLFLLGGLILAGSLLAPGDLLSGALGITAMTVIWDGVEIYRQERRARLGHLKS
jgi:hypothetical protein